MAAFFSRADAIKFIEQSEPDDNNVAFVSISDTIEELGEMRDLWRLTECNGMSLFLKFADTEDAAESGFTPEKAKLITDFLHTAHERKYPVIAHCFMGISRSGAVAKFYNDFYHLNDWYLDDYVGHNKMVYNMLMEAAGVETMRQYYSKQEQDNS